MVRRFFLSSLVLCSWVLPSFSTAQTPSRHPALEGPTAFLTEIANKDWECSFTAYPRVRFFADKIEVLADDGKVTNTLKNVTHPEPGVIRVGFSKGVVVFIFSDDLQSFVVANMKDINEFTVDGAAGPLMLPSVNTATPLDITFKDHPYWKKARLHADKMEVLEEDGKVFVTNPGYAFTPQAQGIRLPEKGAGLVALSRKQPGGWYLSGMHLGTGVRTEKSGYFRFILGSKMTGFAARSVHFTHALLNSGLHDLAAGQEWYGIQLAEDTYGETSETVTRARNELGKLHGYARSYQRSPMWHRRAMEHAKQHHASNKDLHLELGTDLAESLNDAGDFANAKASLAEVHPILQSTGGDVVTQTTFYEALGASEFGLRNYAQAEKLFTENARREQEAKREGSHLRALLRLYTCQLAQNQSAKAQGTLKTLTETQDQYIKQFPNYRFDTWEIAFACASLKKYDDALRYAPTGNRRGWIAYAEYGRLVALLLKGERQQAQQFAKILTGRFSDLDEVRIRNDIDPVTVKLIEAMAAMTPSALAALEQEWATQVESLRNRPLKNYVFARVMVDTIQALKAGM